MCKYIVDIVEEITRRYHVEAESEHEAEVGARELYERGEKPEEESSDCYVGFCELAGSIEGESGPQH